MCRAVLVTRGERIYFATRWIGICIKKKRKKNKFDSIPPVWYWQIELSTGNGNGERSVVYHVAGTTCSRCFIYLLFPVYLALYLLTGGGWSSRFHPPSLSPPPPPLSIGRENKTYSSSYVSWFPWRVSINVTKDILYFPFSFFLFLFTVLCVLPFKLYQLCGIVIKT